MWVDLGHTCCVELCSSNGRLSSAFREAFGVVVRVADGKDVDEGSAILADPRAMEAAQVCARSHHRFVMTLEGWPM